VITGGEKQTLPEVKGEQMQVKGIDSRLTGGGATAGGGERSQVVGRDRRWRGAITGGGERLQVDSERSKHSLN
jgi:hypothetical protein